MNIRPFDYNDHDYEHAFAIDRLIWPSGGQRITDWKHYDKVRPKERIWQQFAIEIEEGEAGQMIGVGSYSESWWNTEINQYSIAVSIHPAYQRQQFGTAFYQFALAQLQEKYQVDSIVADTREDKLGALHILKREGYHLISRVPRSKLQVKQFDPAPFIPLRDKLISEGIRFMPLTVLMKRDPNWQRKLWDLNWVFTQDEPRPDTPKRAPFDEYVAETFDSPSFSPHSWFVAVDGEQYVGFSQLWPNHNNADLLSTGWTGVDRPYRRRGIAIALKLFAIDYANQNNIQRIETDNEETNPMYQINIKLGFQPLPAWVEYRKDFK